MKKRVVFGFLAVLLAFGLLFGWASGVNPYENIYLVGVNDTVLLGLINKNRMPVMRSGVLYAPSNVLDNSGLGLSYAYNKTGGTFTIYTREKTLIFLTTGAGATDKQGNEYTDRIFTRNGVVYIPLRFVASFFELTYSYYTLNLADGTVRIARLCNEDAVLDDQRFGAQAAQLAQQPLNQYLAAQATPSPPLRPQPPRRRRRRLPPRRRGRVPRPVCRPSARPPSILPLPARTGAGFRAFWIRWSVTGSLPFCSFPPTTCPPGMRMCAGPPRRGTRSACSFPRRRPRTPLTGATACWGTSSGAAPPRWHSRRGRVWRGTGRCGRAT